MPTNGVTGEGLFSDGLTIGALPVTSLTALFSVPEPAAYGLLVGFAKLGHIWPAAARVYRTRSSRNLS